MLSVTKKLQSMGGSSVFIVLPKIWVNSRGLKAHDSVELVLNEDLIIKVAKSGDKAK
jgi:phosphate uptake regulator